MTSAHRRVGPRDLSRLQSQLTERDRSVLADVARFRLVSGRQLCRLHFGPGQGSARAAARLLLRLTNHRLLVRLPRQVGGVRAGSAGYVYGIGPVGYRLLHDGTAESRRTEVSDGFLTHTLALTEIAVQLTEGARTGAFELLALDSEPSCWHRVDSLGGSDWLKPDLHVVTLAGDTEWHSFVEWDTGSEHRPALARKLAMYETAYRAGRIAARSGLFPQVVWLVPTAARAELVADLIRSGPYTADLHVVALQTIAVAVLAGQTAAPTAPTTANERGGDDV